MNNEKVKPEDLMLEKDYLLGTKELKSVGDTYEKYYKYRSYRSGTYLPFRGYDFEKYLTLSRELFWNSLKTESTDLKNLDLELAIPFARKESLDFLSKLSSLNVKPKLVGDELDSLGIKLLQGIYKRWSFKSNAKVETFWDLLYGIVNGTVCNYIGYNNSEINRRYLRQYDPATGSYKIETKKEKYWDDVTKEQVPIEDIYIPKIYERNFQKQGRVIWKSQMDEDAFHAEFDSIYPLAKYCYPAGRIAEDSLFFRLLGGTGNTTSNKIEVLRDYDWVTDSYKIVAGGIHLNRLGTQQEFEEMPMPFDHKMGPFTWGPLSPLDAKFAYGLSTPFQSKDPHKILNTTYTMALERELRAVDPAILSSDIETPEFIFGQHKVIQVNDVNAYKEMKLSEPSNQYFNMMNSLQNNMTASNQGGDANIIQSRQPASAREVLRNSELQQQSTSNTVTLYYDLIRQQVLLVLKTALQFYTTSKAVGDDKNLIRTLMVSDMPLTQGGVGNVKIEFEKEVTTSKKELFLQGIKESILNGKQTEVIKVPVEFIKDLEFYIEKIELEPDNASELEMASFIENVIDPMINKYVPMGLADPSKVMMRHLEKLGESASDYVPNKNASQVISGQEIQSNPLGQMRGNMNQSLEGIMSGLNQSGPLTPKFGSQNANKLIK